MYRFILLISSFVYFASCSAQLSLSEEVTENIQLRVENGLNQGIVIGLIDTTGVKYYQYGVKSLQSDEPVDVETLFEIGSVSKVFTAVLLANEVQNGSMDLNDPIDRYLPDGVRSPVFEGEPIRLVQLANHSSGLPRLPANLSPADAANPYADYTDEQLFEFVGKYELTRKPGSQYEYANLGTGLLGNLLAKHNTLNYEQLMRKVIAEPLQMNSTKITIADGEKNFAKGHHMGYEVANWNLATLAGAGAIRSSAGDMVRFLKASMGLSNTDLKEAFQLTRANTTMEKAQPVLGLGWHKTGQQNEIIWHNGGTGGYRSFIGFNENKMKGVVILSNSSESVDDIGFKILEPRASLRAFKPSIATKIRQAIDEKGIADGVAIYHEFKENAPQTYEFGEYELQRLANSYQVKNEFKKALAVLELNLTIYPSSSSTFSNLGEIYFQLENKKAATENFTKALTLNPANTHAAKRLDQLGVDTKSLSEEVIVQNEVLESYKGEYQLAPGFFITITKEDGQLSAQATGQQVFPIFPRTENVFYFKVVEAQLTFNKAENGTIKSVTLLQGGKEIEGKKL